MRSILQLIAAAKRPVLYVGGGVIRGRASEELLALAEFIDHLDAVGERGLGLGESRQGGGCLGSLRKGNGHALNIRKPPARAGACAAAARSGQDLGADAAGCVVLGGLLAVPGGECAPAASSGLASGGV